jgi:hypothetical protein
LIKVLGRLKNTVQSIQKNLQIVGEQLLKIQDVAVDTIHNIEVTEEVDYDK